MEKHLQIALSQYGVKEVRGAKDHPQIVNYFTSLGFDGSKLKDETAWCAAFANWCLKEAGMEYQETLNARSFLNLGEEVFTPKQGDIVVLWRESPNSWKGHVGFFIKESARYVYLLGGNQGNSVSIKAYPKTRLLAYQRPFTK